uniref:Uncharacterized protein n=1 Tax=uncultured bacterium CBNPD1 BAC clone 2089 TaxID=417311 RepID=B1N6R0_9BACT|nr:conserved hypothetical protein [uncultured bacterium CBNPD1 BAC clone 2089]
MASLVCAIDEPDLIAKFSRSAVDLHNLDLLFVGSDPLSVKVHVAEATVCGLCIPPMPVDRMLRLRHAVYGSRDDGANLRSVIAVERPDPAFVHYVLGYGIDDVFDTSVPDAEFAAQLATFAGGRLRACADQLVAGVDLPITVMDGVIDYADEMDRKMVRLISVGYTDREIGEIIGFTHQAMRNRISHLMLRSGIRNRTQLAARYTFESINRGIAAQP